jgi:kynurenine formamidase
MMALAEPPLARTWVDLSHPVRDGLPSGPITAPVSLSQATTMDTAGVNITQYNSPVHVGTHIDAPRHVLVDGATIDQLSLDRTCGEAVCWSVDRSGNEAVTVAELSAKRPKLRPGDILFLHTGWDAYYTAERERYAHHPYLAEEAAAWLVDQRITMVAVDVQTPEVPIILRGGMVFTWPIHRTLLGAGVLIAENVANLGAVTGRRFMAYAWPLPLVGADGAPARIVGTLA